jgi:hypothetical protein
MSFSPSVSSLAPTGAVQERPRCGGNVTCPLVHVLHTYSFAQPLSRQLERGKLVNAISCERPYLHLC